MPTRVDTRRSYEVWIRNYILPRWGDCALSDLEPRPVEMWLASLALSPKSRAHIRGVLRVLWDFAAWRGDIPRGQRNPMELVTVKGASKRVAAAKPHRGRIPNFRPATREPFRPMALLCAVSVCGSVSVSRSGGPMWIGSDGKLRVERGIVAQHVDDVKTDGIPEEADH